MNNLAKNALNEYQSTGNSSIVYSNPHQLILRLLDGALQRIAQAKGAIQQKNIQQRGELISKAIGIINGLRGCLDHEQEGDLSANLESLYEYMNLRLLEANVEENTQKLDEVLKLLLEIKSAWVQITPEIEED